MNKIKTAKFNVGQVIHHRLYDYRGVIIDVDPQFSATEEWYEQNAISHPAKNAPWYHVLVHNAIHRTYVAESNLEEDILDEPIDHPEVEDYFSSYKEGFYLAKGGVN